MPPSSSLHSDPISTTDDQLESTVRQVIESIILEEDQFDVRDALPNVVPDPSSLLLKSEYSCPVGKVSMGLDVCCSCFEAAFYDIMFTIFMLLV